MEDLLPIYKQNRQRIESVALAKWTLLGIEDISNEPAQVRPTRTKLPPIK